MITLFSGRALYWVLFFLCFGIVAWQLYVGTSKYISSPHGVTTYSEQLVMPDLTVCHQWGVLGYDVNPMGLQVDQYIDKGVFSGSDSQMSAEDVFVQATEQYYYLLDQRGRT